jgi:ribosome-associated translation inhibitor RaiA
MKHQRLQSLPAEKQIEPDSGASELHQARIKIAALLQQNLQLEFAQKQTERLLSVQGEQIRERVRAEFEKLDMQLQEKDQTLQKLQSNADALEANLNAKIRELQVQLAEKTLIIESRNKEVNDLKAAINSLSQRLTRWESGRK